MLNSIHPKLPMRNKALTKDFYLGKMKFKEIADYGNYLIIRRDFIEIHFFEFEKLNPEENYGQVYIRTDDIESLYKTMVDDKVSIHPHGNLETKPWGQKEFSILDDDNNLLTFGQVIT